MNDAYRANRQFERTFDSRYKTLAQEETFKVEPKLIVKIIYFPEQKRVEIRRLCQNHETEKVQKL